MGVVDEILAEQRAQAQGQQAKASNGEQGYFSGFIESALSSPLELFGQSPTKGAQAFRNENPISGIVSGFVGPLGIYSAAGKLSTLPRAAAALESGVAGFGINALEQPVLAGIARESLRYAPVEAARLGGGLLTAPEENYGELFADVALSTALTGVFGGIGGFFRAGGAKAPVTGRIAGGELGLKPTFELRLAKQETAEVTGDLSVAELRANLLQDALTERPQEVQGRFRGKYINELDNGTPEEVTALNALFKAGGGKGYQKQFLVEGPETQLTSINPGEAAEIAAKAGFDDIEDLAAHVVYPRHVRVASAPGAGQLAKTFDTFQGLTTVSPSLRLGREPNSGLWVFAKRLESGEAAGNKAYGTSKIAPGDRWLIGKTDKPARLAPELVKATDTTVAEWAKLRDAFQPSRRDDFFNRTVDQLNSVMTPEDFQSLRTQRTRTWIEKTAGPIQQRLLEYVPGLDGVIGGQSGKQVAGFLADVFKPAIFRENEHPLYQRLWGLLRGSVMAGDAQLNKILFGDTKFLKSPLRAPLGQVEHGAGFEGKTPIADLWKSLDKADLQQVAIATQAQHQGEAIQELVQEGLISAKAAKVVEELQAINQDVLSKLVLPALKSAGLEGKFLPAEGYVAPRIVKGDWFVDLLDKKGNVQWRVYGKTPLAAQQEAKLYAEEAATRGLEWKVARDTAQHLVADSVDQLDEIIKQIDRGAGQNKDLNDIINSVSRKLLKAQLGKEGVVRPGLPGTFKKRTGLEGNYLTHEYTADELIKASEAHYRQLLRFSAYKTWQERWLPEAFNLEKIDKNLYTDLLRKGNQLLGIEGQITQQLNNVLRPVLGSTLGNKPATKIAQELNGLMYNFNLGIANPTFAILNLLQPLQTTVPWISHMINVPTAEAAKKMLFLPRYGADGKVLGSAGFLHPMKVLGAGIKLMGKPTPELQQMLQRAVDDNVLTAQTYEEFAGHSSRAFQTLRVVAKEQGGWAFIKRSLNYIAEKSETFSRMATFNSAYVLGKDFFQLEGEQLYQFAKRATHIAMFGYNTVDRSRLFTGPIGSQVGLFKNWQFHFIGSMAEYAGLAVSKGIYAPMLWQGGAALAVGGLAATPLKVLADGLAKWYSDSPSSFHWLQENWGSTGVGGEDGTSIADATYFGLPAFLGASLQSSATIPGTDVRNDVTNMFNIVLLERLKQAGQAIGASASYANETGANPLADPNLRDQLVGALTPRAFFRAASVVEGDYIKSMRSGYPQIRDVNTSTRLLYGLGMNQLEVDKQQIASRELYKDQEATRSAVQALGARFAAAQEAGDSGAMQEVLDQVMVRSLSLDSVMRSAQTRARRETEGDLLSRFSKEQQAKYRSVIGE